MDGTSVGSRPAKDALFEALAGVARAMSSGRRAQIVELLAQGERSVEEVATALGQSVANTSHHLRTLARAGLVTTRRDGTRIHYSLANARVAHLWATIREVAVEQLADIERLAAAYLGDRRELDTITRAELTERLEDGSVTVLDVRPEAEYRAGHVAGARSIPIDELRQRLDDLSTDVEVVAYCRGPYCVYADEAVRTLRERGVAARRLEEGFPEWLHAGLPVETEAHAG